MTSLGNLFDEDRTEMMEKMREQAKEIYREVLEKRGEEKKVEEVFLVFEKFNLQIDFEVFKAVVMLNE